MSRTIETIAVRLGLVRCIALGALLVILITGCSRKAAQVPPNAPEVLVTTVKAQDIPVIKERVASLDGLVNATIMARVSGAHCLPELPGGHGGQKGRSPLSDRCTTIRRSFGPG